MFKYFWKHCSNTPLYAKCGGEQTLKSYSSKEEFYKQLDFLKSFPLYLEYKNYKTDDGRYLVVSHSNVGQTWELRNSSNEVNIKRFENQLLWSRYKNFDNSEIFNVYGHTIRSEVKLTEFDCNIDLGCYQSKEKIPNPRLCALEFPSMKIITQESLED